MPYLLLNLKSVHNRSQLTKDLIGPFVIFQLGRDQVGEIPQRLWGIQYLDSH